MNNLKLILGQDNHISADGGEKRYKAGIKDHSPLKGFDSDDLGLSAHGLINGFGYQAGVVKATTDATTNKLQWSVGARVNFTAMDTEHMGWALGAGYVHVKHHDVEINVIGDGDPGKYNRFDGWTADLSGKFDKFAMTASFYERCDKSDNLVKGPEAQSNSYGLAVSYLLIGDSYTMSNGMISGPKFESTAFLSRC
jgi:hypothetical protein